MFFSRNHKQYIFFSSKSIKIFLISHNHISIIEAMIAYIDLI